MGDGVVNGEQGGAACERGEVALKCPECGSARSERTPAVPWLVRHRLKFKCAAFLLVLGFMVWKNVGAWPPMFKPRTWNTFPASLLAHKYTRADLEQYASGEMADGQLLTDVQHPFLMGTYKLDAGFQSPQGTVNQITWHGWPAVLTRRQTMTDYDDVFEKTNPSSAVALSNDGWRGLVYMGYGKTAEGGFTGFGFFGYMIIVPLAVLVTVIGLGRTLRAVLIVFHVAAKDGTRRRDRLIRRVPLLCALLCIIGITLASLQEARYPKQIFPKITGVTSAALNLTTVDIARLADAPSGESEFARTVLDATAELPANPDDTLAIGWSSDQGMTVQEGRGGWLDLMMYTHFWNTQAVDNGRTGWPHISIRRHTTELDILLRWGDPLARLEDYSLAMYPASKLLLSLFAAWWTPGAAAMLAHWWVRRRAAKRVARGWCSRCGYDLSGL